MNKIVKLLKSINRRSLKYGSLSIILIVIVVAIAVILNLFVGMLQDKGIVKKFDLSANKMFSIGDTTKGILKNITSSVTFLRMPFVVSPIENFLLEIQQKAFLRMLRMML